MTGFGEGLKRRGGKEEPLLFKRHVNLLAELHSGSADKRHSFRPRLNMRFLLLRFVRLHRASPEATFAPRRPAAILPFLCLHCVILFFSSFLRFFVRRPGVRFVSFCSAGNRLEDEPRKGNNKVLDHVYHTLLDIVSSHRPPWKRLPGVLPCPVEACSDLVKRWNIFVLWIFAGGFSFWITVESRKFRADLFYNSPLHFACEAQGIDRKIRGTVNSKQSTMRAIFGIQPSRKTQKRRRQLKKKDDDRGHDR